MRSQEDVSDNEPTAETQSEILSQLQKSDPVAESNPRSAVLSHRDGIPIGVCIVLSVADLEALEISTDEVDSIHYWVDPDENVVECRMDDELDRSAGSLSD
ncbi:MAG: hypothetical protein ABEI86_11440 [Halobacteriaceae archaeon]